MLPSGKHPFRAVISRRRKKTLAAVFLLLLLPTGVVLDRQLLRPMRQSLRIAAWAGDDYKRYHGRHFTVVRVIDGDTLDIGIADGDRPATRIRLLGVDTPETHHPTTEPMFFGPEATAYVHDLVHDQEVTVLLDTVAEHRDRYGRLLAYVVLPNEDVLNEELIRNGYGYADLRFSHSRFDAYVELMATAIDRQAGLWPTIGRDQLPEWLRRRRPDLPR